jgi:regulator of protease activity HflC (stomatin/prohibitin superfamily)
MFTGLLTLLGSGSLSLIILFNSLVMNDPSRKSIVKMFGKPTKVCGEGLNFRAPFITQVDTVSMTLRSVSVKAGSITSDKVPITVTLTVQYVVGLGDKAVYDFVYKLGGDGQEYVRQICENSVKAMVPSLSLDQLYADNSLIQQKVLSELKNVAVGFGLDVVGVLVSDFAIPQGVSDAMGEINAADRARQAAIANVEAVKTKEIGLAEAEAASRKLKGEGWAAQRDAIFTGMADVVSRFSRELGDQVTYQEVLEFVLAIEKLDTTKRVAERSNKIVFMPYEASTGGLEGSGQQERLLQMLLAQGVDVVHETVEDAPHS